MAILFALLPLIALCQCQQHGFDDHDASSFSLEWGTYRPGVYFGTRARSPDSPQFGLMWYDADLPDSHDHIRHECDPRDELDSYGWLKHDGRSFGFQELLDGKSGVNISTEWSKFFMDDDTEAWTLRISANRFTSKIPNKTPAAKDAKIDARAGLIWYWFTEAESTNDAHPGFEIIEALDGTSLDGTKDVSIQGSGWPDSSQDFSFVAVAAQTSSISNIDWLSAQVQPSKAWDVKDLVRRALMHDLSRQVQEYKTKHGEDSRPTYDDIRLPLRLPNARFADASTQNVIVFQRIFTLPFEQEFIYIPKKSSINLLSAQARAEWHAAGQARWQRQFEAKFGAVREQAPENQQKFVESAVSQLIGGIGFFSGDWIAHNQQGTQPDRRGPTSLYSAVPSRALFPRGFLWDEGFHALITSRWDTGIAAEIFESWFSQADADGWIPREQILGPEARSRVPGQFQVQKSTIANPPTLLMSLVEMIERVVGEINVEIGPHGELEPPNEAHPSLEFLERVYPVLRRYVRWFFKTQRNRHRAGSYRWGGRTKGHCLASGLDDYPRAPNVVSNEGHADLHSWLTAACRWMSRVASHLGKETDAKQYEEKAEDLRKSLDQFHWDSETGRFADFFQRANETEPSFFVADGYVALFPLMLRLLDPESTQLGRTFEWLHDVDGVWSPWGIRSLAAYEPLFGSEEDYWRGSIWMNMNFLICGALKFYGQVPGPWQSQAAEMYEELRQNLVENVVEQWEQTGYIWEQYDGKTGFGKRTRPFTGWSSLIALIISEDFPS